jgi:hypothetical protein
LTTINSNHLNQEEMSDYVAQLQLHMTLQARKLVPTLNQIKDSRENLLHQTQATIEKFTSRQLV